MRIIFVAFMVVLLLATAFAGVDKVDKCDKLCFYHKTPGICGKSVDNNAHCVYKFFRNYCDLRKHNCRNQKNRYQAELDLKNCPGKEIPPPYHE